MILHCAPPYEVYTPNPALGYLKGYLQDQGIPVRNVYWNLIMDSPLGSFQKDVEDYTKHFRYFSLLTSLYVTRHLLTDPPDDTPTPLHLFYTAAFSREEIAEKIHAIREHVDQYITQNCLHEDPLSGFTLKTIQWPMNLYVMRRLKALNPDLSIVVGGIRNQSQAEEFMRLFAEADYAIWGEGEVPLTSLVRAREEGTPLDGIPNLVYRQGKTLISSGETCECLNLDSLPFADHSDYFATYEKYPFQSENPITLPIWGSRACPWNRCRFCVLNEEATYRARSPESVVRELEYHAETHDVENFIFVDTELAGTQKRFKTLLRLLVESATTRKVKYYIFAETSPIFIDPENAHLMQLITFHQVQIGFEAMTDALLAKMRKRQTFAHNIQALKLGDEYGLKIDGLNIIRGIPSETREDIVESCANLRFLRFYLNQFTLNPGLLKLWRGAPFYEDVPPTELPNWKEDPFYSELAPLNLVDDSNRFEFFGFYTCTLDPMWTVFEDLLTFYTRYPWSYEWIEYPDSSTIEERGAAVCEYGLDRDETDVMIFCDRIKSFQEVRERFSHVSADHLREIMETLRSAGLLYYDKDMHTIISVLEAKKRKVLSVPQ